MSDVTPKVVISENPDGAPTVDIALGDTKELAKQEEPTIETYGRVNKLRKFDAPNFDEMNKPIRERMKDDLEEAKQLIGTNFDGTYFTIPSTNLKLGIIPLSEASWQRFFLQTRTGEPPPPPDKIVKDRRGRDVPTANYDDENFQRYLGVVETHQTNNRQAQVGEMLEYIYDRGLVVEIPTDWIVEYEDSLSITTDLSVRELKNIFITEHMTTGGETKAIQILICSRDPLGFGEEDPDEDGKDNSNNG